MNQFERHTTSSGRTGTARASPLLRTLRLRLRPATATARASDDYGADKIKVLEGLEAVRKRPAMYIGSTGAPGLHHLVYEIVDNSIDEALAGYCDQVNVTIHIDNSVTVDRQRPRHSGRSARQRQVGGGSRADRAARRRQVRQRQLQGLGRSARRRRLGRQRAVRVARARDLAQRPGLQADATSAARRRPTSRSPARPRSAAPRSPSSRTRRSSRPSSSASTRWRSACASSRSSTAASPSRIDDERDGKAHKFLYEGGIVSFVEYLNQNKASVNDKPIYMHGEKDGIDVEIALQWNDGYAETLYSFANNINTHEGGTHLSGFRSALTRTINSYAGKNNLAKDLKDANISGDDIREGLTASSASRFRGRSSKGRPRRSSATPRSRASSRRSSTTSSARILEENPDVAKRVIAQGGRCGARARGGAQGARPGAPQGRARQQHAAGQAGRLPGARSRAERDLHRRRRIGRRLGQAGARPALPGDPADQGQDPQRREGALRQDARQRRDQDDDRGARLRHRRRGLRRREAPLPPHHHHDRRGRRRLAHPHAAADVLLPADARAGRRAATSTSRSRRCSAPSAAAARCSSATSASSRPG